MSNFDNIYNKIINNNSYVFKKYNNKLIFKFFMLSYLSLIIILLFNSIPLLVISLMIFIIISLIFLKKYSIIKKEYKQADEAFNNLVVNYICKDLFPNCTISKEGISQIEYDEFDNDGYSIYKSINQLKTIINNKNITLSYAEALNETEKSKIRVFCGLVMKININKTIKEKLIIKTFPYNFGKGRINLDYNLFEKYFNVLTNDKMMAYRILTPDIMEYLLNLQNELNNQYYSKLLEIIKNFEVDNETSMKIYIKLENNSIYIKFDCGNIFLYRNDLKEDLYDSYFFLYKIKELSNKLIDIIETKF